MIEKLERTTQLFQFADKYKGSYNNALKPFVFPFYYSYSGYKVSFQLLRDIQFSKRRHTYYSKFVG